MAGGRVEYKLCDWCNRWNGECYKVTESIIVDNEKRTISLQTSTYPSGAYGTLFKNSEGDIKLVRKCGYFPETNEQINCDGYNS